ncbi:MAG TPA: hypothetical protein VF765_01710, partial [Polyangiaceae bacterium]
MAKKNDAEGGAAAKGLPTKLFATARAWEQWLDRNHDRSRGVWLKLARATAGIESLGYAGALEIALLFGWIDG